MLTSNQADLRTLEQEGLALSAQQRLGRAEDPWLQSIDFLQPAVSISTADCAEQYRYVKLTDGDEPIKFHHHVIPYLRGIEDACDEYGVTVVAVKGPARSAKTTAAENKVFKNWRYGPSLDVIWYMQTKDDVEEYCEERLEWMLKHHEELNRHVNWNDRRHRLTRKRIRGSLARFLAATHSTLRGKMAPIIVGDEIDGYAPKVRKGFLTMARNRQRELGLGALLYVCSHPDAGPKEGVDAILKLSLQHLWHWNCVHCHKASSPAAEAEVRMNWNVTQLLEGMEDIERSDLLDMVEQEAALVCPHCKGKIDNNQRLEMSRRGKWLQPGQTLDEKGEIVGARSTEKIMGFVIHAFMSPWLTIGELAREFVSAKLNAEDTQDETNLKEHVCKTMGETYMGAKPEEQMENWKTVQARLSDPGYRMGTVPHWCRYLTAFVDVQGDRFEVVVIGRGRAKQSALVDRFALKQTAGFRNIDPANRLGDWRVIEEAVLEQSWPLAVNPEREKAGLPPLFLSVAKTLVDAHGSPGVHINAVNWVANITNPRRHGKQPVESWKIQLTKGDAHKNSAFVGAWRKLLKDDRGKELEHGVIERTINVHHGKLILARRMKISEPGPGRMHLPYDLPARYVRELTSESLVNGVWVASGRNETFDGWVSSEAADVLLMPERPGIDWADPDTWPIWATPLPRSKPGEPTSPNAEVAPTPKSYYDRMLEASGRGGDRPDEGDDDVGDLYEPQ